LIVDEAVNLIRASIQADRLCHAYLVIGPPRAEGRELAERVLAMLFCEATERPCGNCRPCGQISAHTHPDAAWLEPQKR